MVVLSSSYDSKCDIITAMNVYKSIDQGVHYVIIIITDICYVIGLCIGFDCRSGLKLIGDALW